MTTGLDEADRRFCPCRFESVTPPHQNRDALPARRLRGGPEQNVRPDHPLAHLGLGALGGHGLGRTGQRRGEMAQVRRFGAVWSDFVPGLGDTLLLSTG